MNVTSTQLPAVALAGSRAEGDGHTVVIFPGLGGNGASVAVLREHCRMLGYDAIDWGQGFNAGPRGELDPWLLTLADHVADLLAHHGRPASLIGWSLGGLYARELGKLLTPQLRQVITIGTPFNAGADSSQAGWLHHLLNHRPAAPDEDMVRHLRTPPALHTTSIYGRSDGAVAGQHCCHDEASDRVQDIEVRAAPSAWAGTARSCWWWPTGCASNLAPGCPTSLQSLRRRRCEADVKPMPDRQRLCSAAAAGASNNFPRPATDTVRLRPQLPPPTPRDTP